MSCCGNNRGTVQGSPVNPRTLASQSGGNWAGVVFEYLGATGLTAVGSITRRQYLFPQRGSKITVDRRDVESLRAIPLLREVR
jgi:hypothetical protein